MHSKRNIALLGVFVFFLLLFNTPLLSLPAGHRFGVPDLMLYIGIVWILFTGVMGVMSRSKKEP